MLRHGAVAAVMACRALAGVGLVVGAFLAVPVPAQEAVRAEVGRPLQAAQELIKARKYQEALARVRDADAVSNKTANESYLVERMRLAAASGAGDLGTAAKSFEAVAAKVAPADRLKMIESLADSCYRARDYAKSMQWSRRYFKEGGTSTTMRTLLIQSQYLVGDFAGAARELRVETEQAEKGGAVPGEDRLKLLVNATLKMNDTHGYVWALEQLVAYYPKKAYWVDLLARIQRKPTFSDRLTLDAYRLSLATDSMSTANDYMEMAQLSLQAGFPGEAKQVLDKGYAAGALGKGDQAERHKRLGDLVIKKVDEDKKTQSGNLADAGSARDGTALVNTGFGLIFSGDKARGLQLMERGMARGNMKRENDAKLHLGIAQLLAGQAAAAQATLKRVGGTDGTADLARLWLLFSKTRT